ncbi:YqeB family protein [Streptoalloteichus tenebrarius]|nr:hypothetical protein [Streptoalloteichus tenebrarius]
MGERPTEVAHAGAEPTVVREPAWVRAGVWVVPPPLGAGVLWGLKSISGWIASLSWFPAQGVFRLVSEIAEPYATAGAVALGLVAGLVLSAIIASEQLTVTVSHREVRWRRDGKEGGVDRGRIASVFVDRKALVLLDAAGAELARETSDLARERLRDAFRAHGYPWRDEGDPFEHDYRLWVDGTDELSATANALLRERQRALREDEDDEARVLRAELAKLGVFVREEKKRQYWRTKPEVSGERASSG